MINLPCSRRLWLLCFVWKDWWRQLLVRLQVCQKKNTVGGVRVTLYVLKKELLSNNHNYIQIQAKLVKNFRSSILKLQSMQKKKKTRVVMNSVSFYTLPNFVGQNLIYHFHRSLMVHFVKKPILNYSFIPKELNYITKDLP